jgi:hypothetical protein
MPFLFLALEEGGGGVGGYMSCCCCEPSRNSSSPLEMPSLLSINASFFASMVKLASPFRFTPTSYVFKENVKQTNRSHIINKTIHNQYHVFIFIVIN